MPRIKHTVEQIITKLRETEVVLLARHRRDIRQGVSRRFFDHASIVEYPNHGGACCWFIYGRV